MRIVNVVRFEDLEVLNGSEIKFHMTERFPRRRIPEIVFVFLVCNWKSVERDHDSVFEVRNRSTFLSAITSRPPPSIGYFKINESSVIMLSIVLMMLLVTAHASALVVQLWYQGTWYYESTGICCLKNGCRPACIYFVLWTTMWESAREMCYCSLCLSTCLQPILTTSNEWNDNDIENGFPLKGI